MVFYVVLVVVRVTRNISKETTKVKLRFYHLLEQTIKTLTLKGTDPAEILKVLPPSISSQFQSEEALTIDSIFKEDAALDKELKWYSFSPLKDIINELCDDECKQRHEDYVETLKSYLQSRIVPHFIVPSGGKLPTYSSPCARTILVDPEWSQKLVSSKSDLSERDFIASLLDSTSKHVKFVSFVSYSCA